MRSIVVMGAVAALTGCASRAPVEPEVVDLGVAFDAAAARSQLGEGKGQIKGGAFIRQQGGGVVTCAGRDVSLVPATPYAAKIYQVLYGTDQGTAMRLPVAKRVKPTSSEFGQVMKKTQCDAQGAFAFDGIKDGDYFVETVVTWRVGLDQQGGAIMRRVSLAGGQQISIVVSP